MDNNSSNIFNEELQSKWEEIEEKRTQKLSELNEFKKINIFNSYQILNIDLNSLIHPTTDDSEFEDFCVLKYKELEQMKKNFDNSDNLFDNITSKSKFRRNKKKYDNIFKTADKTLTTDNKRNSNSKLKFNMEKLLDNFEDDSDISYNNSRKRNSYRNIEINREKQKNSFLNFDNENDNMLIINKTYEPSYKKYKGKNIKSNGVDGKDRIKNKLEENINYLNSIYPNSKSNNNFLK